MAPFYRLERWSVKGLSKNLNFGVLKVDLENSLEKKKSEMLKFMMENLFGD